MSPVGYDHASGAQRQSRADLMTCRCGGVDGIDEIVTPEPLGQVVTLGFAPYRRGTLGAVLGRSESCRIGALVARGPPCCVRS